MLTIKRSTCIVDLLEVNLWNSVQAKKAILALTPRADITRSPKQGHQWPTKRIYVLSKLFFFKYIKYICIKDYLTDI